MLDLAPGVLDAPPVSNGKRCPACGLRKTRSEFYRNRAQHDGLSTRCRPCDKLRVRAWELANPDRDKAHRLKYRERRNGRRTNPDDQRGTPDDLWSAILEGFGIDEFCLDPSSSVPPRIPAKAHFDSIHRCGLTEPWNGRFVFTNPPYSDLKPWVAKMLREHALDPDKRIVALIPNAPTTTAYNNILDSDAVVIELKGRVKFVDLTGQGRNYGARNPSALPIWGATTDEITAIRDALALKGYQTRLR